MANDKAHFMINSNFVLSSSSSSQSTSSCCRRPNGTCRRVLVMYERTYWRMPHCRILPDLCDFLFHIFFLRHSWDRAKDTHFFGRRVHHDSMAAALLLLLLLPLLLGSVIASFSDFPDSVCCINVGRFYVTLVHTHTRNWYESTLHFLRLPVRSFASPSVALSIFSAYLVSAVAIIIQCNGSNIVR